MIVAKLDMRLDMTSSALTLAGKAGEGHDPIVLRIGGRATVAHMILIASDNSVDRGFLADLLISGGYSVVVTSTGEDALDRVQQGGVDLLITTMIMPQMDGLELLRSLRDLPKGPPVIALTAGADVIDGIYLRGALLLGAVRAYTQPLIPSIFLDNVRELLQLRPD